MASEEMELNGDASRGDSGVVSDSEQSDNKRIRQRDVVSIKFEPIAYWYLWNPLGLYKNTLTE